MLRMLQDIPIYFQRFLFVPRGYMRHDMQHEIGRHTPPPTLKARAPSANRGWLDWSGRGLWLGPASGALANDLCLPGAGRLPGYRHSASRGHDCV
jgi:hypothetical protein